MNAPLTPADVALASDVQQRLAQALNAAVTGQQQDAVSTTLRHGE